MKRILSGIIFSVLIFGMSLLYSAIILLKIYSDISRETRESFQDFHNSFLELLAESRIIPLPSPTPALPPAGVIHRSSGPAKIPTPPPHISEDQLWQALADYRQAQNRNHLVKEESLCVYARKRVEEHHSRYLTLKPGDQTLDSHAGFERDAANESVFKETNFSALAENLAYLPEYATATQIIEWGWDSSFPHRNAQLSNDWSHACISGRFPFYVGIFAHR